MTAVACSSLLKILEEPPPGLHFILLSAEPGRLFPTILSRCQRFTLLPLSNGEITELLLERTALSREAAELIARLSGGLPGRALALAGDETFKERLAGAASLVRELARSGGNPRNWLTRAGELAEREDLVPLLELLHLCLRDALILSLCRRNDLLINPGNARLWEDLPASALLEEAVELVSATISDLLTTNVNRRLALEICSCCCKEVVRMPRVVGVRFRQAGKYIFGPNGLKISTGENVIVGRPRYRDGQCGDR